MLWCWFASSSGSILSIPPFSDMFLFFIIQIIFRNRAVWRQNTLWELTSCYHFPKLRKWIEFNTEGCFYMKYMDLRNIRHFPELSIPKSFLLLWTGHTSDTQQTADRMQRRRNSITHPKPEGGRDGLCLPGQQASQSGRQEGQ